MQSSECWVSVLKCRFQRRFQRGVQCGVVSLPVSFQKGGFGGIQVRSMWVNRFFCKLIDKCKCEKYSHFSMSRMAGRAAGHRYKVGGWTDHVGEVNPRAAILDLITWRTAINWGKRDGLSVFCKWRRKQRKVQIQLCRPGACDYAVNRKLRNKETPSWSLQIDSYKKYTETASWSLCLENKIEIKRRHVSACD